MHMRLPVGEPPVNCVRNRAGVRVRQRLNYSRVAACGYRKLDANKSATIGVREFQAAMQHLNIALTEATVQRLFHLLDNDRDGLLNYNEFLAGFDARSDARVNADACLDTASPQAVRALRCCKPAAVVRTELHACLPGEDLRKACQQHHVFARLLNTRRCTCCSAALWGDRGGG